MKTCPKCQKQFSDDANFCPVDAARLTTAMAKITGTDSLTARFDVGDRIAGGSRTGALHRAKDKQSSVGVMVKLVAPEVMALPGVAQRLERELKQLERVQSAGVAKIVASGKRDDQVWIAVEALEGAQTLYEAISARGPIPVDQAARLVEVIGEALIEAAQVGVVHRDLAPKNILFAGGEIKLINFPLPVPTAEKIPGVAEFVAPEQQDGKPVDQRSNIYSLGALYYYLLAGVPPTPGAGDRTALTDVPPAVEAMITRALDRSPTKRFLTVRQFVDEVGRISRAAEPFDPKATAAMGKAGKPKAQIVETLLGLREGMAPIPKAAVPITSAPTVGAGVPVLASVSTPISTGTAIGLAGGADPVSQPERSPWAPPAQTQTQTNDEKATQPIEILLDKPKPPVMPAPVVAAPVIAAPVLPVAPVVAAAPTAKKKGDEPRKEKGKFRETMWFKKGELDSTAAISAEAERARTGKSVADKADSLPIDERYKDDGSITRGDADKYSLRTGGTQMMNALQKEPGGTSKNGVSEDALIGEMKGGRTWVFVAIGAAVLGIGLVIFMLAR